MSTDSYARKVLMAQALADGITIPPGQKKSEKRDQARKTSIFPSLTKQLLRRKSTSDPKPKTKYLKRFSLPAIVPTPRGNTVDIEEKISTEDGLLDEAYSEILSLENFSNGRASIFKLRGASSRFWHCRKKSSSRVACTKESQPSSLISKKESLLGQKLVAPAETVDHIAFPELSDCDSDLQMSNLVDFPKNSPSESVMKIEKGDLPCVSPFIGSVQSAVSDWRDDFVISDTDSDFGLGLGIDKEVVDSNAPSTASWGSNPDCELSNQCRKSIPLEPKLPPAGMVLVAWLNTRTGNRFSNFPLETKLVRVIDWLGSPLPVVVHEPGRSARRCDAETVLARVVGQSLGDPSKQGIGFFIGPVNGVVNYVLKVCDLTLLYALRTAEDEEEEKLQTWL